MRFPAFDGDEAGEALNLVPSFPVNEAGRGVVERCQRSLPVCERGVTSFEIDEIIRVQWLKA